MTSGDTNHEIIKFPNPGDKNYETKKIPNPGFKNSGQIPPDLNQHSIDIPLDIIL